MTDTTTITLPPDMPSRMRQLPRDSVGRPVPWFVPKVKGKYDFRFTDSAKIVKAIKGELCFVCGERLHRIRGAHAPRGTFVAGPMCLINRTSAEPPNHHDCAVWSSRACPFLTKPLRIRRLSDMPEDVSVAGVMIDRNPGASALIDSDRWQFFTVPDGQGGKGVLFNMDRITSVRWMAEGGAATADQVMASIESGIPSLIGLAEKQDGAMRALAIKTRAALRWLPGEVDMAEYPTVAGVLARLP